MWATDTVLIANLNNNFSDPTTGQALTFSVSSTNADVKYMPGDLTNGFLKLYSLVNAEATSTITITCTDPLNKTANNQFYPNLHKKIYIPPAPTLTLPTNGSINQSYFPVLTWTIPSEATVSLLEIAKDINFSNIVFR